MYRPNMEITATFKSNFGICFLVVLLISSRIGSTEHCPDCQEMLGVPCTITPMASCDNSDMMKCVPDSYDLKPAKATDCDITNFVEDGSVGFNISFGLPADGSRSYLGGLTVMIRELSWLTSKCYCIQIESAHCMDPDFYPRLTFDCSTGWKDESEYLVVIQSLPASDDNHVLVQRKVGKMLNGTNQTDPCKWQLSEYTTEITEDSQSKTWDITIGFKFPIELNLRRFSFAVMSNYPDNCTFMEVEQDVKEIIWHSGETEAKVTLTTPNPGIQCIRVRASPDDRNDGISSNCEPMTFFRVNIDESKTTRVRREPNILHKTKSRGFDLETCTEVPGKPGFHPAIAIVPIGMIAVLFIAGIAVFRHWRRTKKPKSQNVSQEIGGSFNQLEGLNTVWMSDVPRVFLVYSNDFDEHLEAVIKLAEFLKKCHINIILDCWETLASVNAWQWMVGGVEKAHKVLVIHSRGTFIKYNCYKQGIPFEDTKPSPRRDLFLNFVKHFDKYLDCDDWRKMGKFVKAHFHYTKKEHIADDANAMADTYILMHHIKELVADLHGTTASADDFRLSHIDFKNWDKDRNCGSALKHSMDAAVSFLKDKPKWYKEKYRLGTPRSDATSGMASIREIGSQPKPLARSLTNGSDEIRNDLPETDSGYHDGRPSTSSTGYCQDIVFAPGGSSQECQHTETVDNQLRNFQRIDDQFQGSLPIHFQESDDFNDFHPPMSMICGNNLYTDDEEDDENDGARYLEQIKAINSSV